METKHKQLDIFRHTDAGKAMRRTLPQAIEATRQSLLTYGSTAKCWVVGFSGGKDSSATITVIDHLISEGKLPRPDHLIAVYSDTMMELPSLEYGANQLLAHLETRGWRVIRGQPALKIKGKTLSDRYFVQLLGRGVAVPNNRNRWCTRKLKTESIERTYKLIGEEYGEYLGIDGIRKGESAARDARILASCSVDDGECGQGWFHKSAANLKLSPILSWRVCHVADWLAEANFLYGYPLNGVMQTYGFDQLDGEEPLALRTGCLGCPLVTTGNPDRPTPDKALATVLDNGNWPHLAPYQGLAAVYHALRWDHSKRLVRATKNKVVAGAITIEARRWALAKILEMQTQSAKLALEHGFKPYILIADDELSYIQELLDAGTYPLGYTGDEPLAITLKQ